MEILKKLFGDGALTFAQFSEALSAHPEIKLADLAGGEYVEKGNKVGVVSFISQRRAH